MKALALFFSILILLFTARPELSWLGVENLESCCEQTDCQSDKSDQKGTESEKGICNPFQCQTCCFVLIRKSPEFRWLKQEVRIEHFTPLLVIFPHGAQSVCWQPPKSA